MVTKTALYIYIYIYKCCVCISHMMKCREDWNNLICPLSFKYTPKQCRRHNNNLCFLYRYQKLKKMETPHFVRNKKEKKRKEKKKNFIIIFIFIAYLFYFLSFEGLLKKLRNYNIYILLP